MRTRKTPIWKTSDHVKVWDVSKIKGAFTTSDNDWVRIPNRWLMVSECCKCGLEHAQFYEIRDGEIWVQELSLGE